MSGEAMLGHAATIVADRRQVYGDPAVSMAAVAKRWSITLGRTITPAEVVPTVSMSAARNSLIHPSDFAVECRRRWMAGW